MNEIQKKISEAYKILSTMLVYGDAVEVVTAVRVTLKEAYKLAGDKSALWEAHKQADEKEPTDG